MVKVAAGNMLPCLQDRWKTSCRERVSFANYPKIQDLIPQGEWGIVPMISEGDTQVRIKWEDEQGKINIKGQLSDVDTQGWLSELFRIRGVDQAVLDRMVQPEMQQIQLLAELHKIMSDEEFDKVSGYLTAYSFGKSINVNTASEVVLESMGIKNPSLIVAHRVETPYKQGDTIPGATGVQTRGNQNITNFLVTSSTNTVYKVYSHATVGGYTKQIEAVINMNNSSTPLYWRAL